MFYNIIRYDSHVIKEKGRHVTFPMECALFVNKKAHLSITAAGITQYYIKSASAAMGTRRQANGCNKIQFYSTTKVARLCVPLLLKFLMAGLLSYFLCYCKTGA
jgi:hypothetical protein